MAFRIEAAARGLTLVLAAAALAAAQPLTLQVRHGALVFTDSGVRYQGKHPHEWNYPEIQRLGLMPNEITIRTYDDIRWQLGRDREYRFNRIAEGETAKLYPLLAARLDQRLVARIAIPLPSPLWQAPAKLLHRTGGANGELKIGSDRIVFDGKGGSRTWRYSDIDNISSSGPFDLSLTSLDGESRLQLKQALSQDRYNDLWRRITEANGLKVFQSRMEHTHD